MGVESTAILVRWINEPSTRPCALDQLIVVTAMTGDEYEDTRTLVETYVFPLLRQHGIQYVQLARAGHLEQDGIIILDDTRTPQKLHLEGAYKLSDELRLNGTVPQVAGVHRCALKFKAFVIEKWLDAQVRPAFFRHALGYNSDEGNRVEHSEYATTRREAEKERIAFGFNTEEQNRIARSCEYNTVTREAFYPLVEWSWTREKCLAYLYEAFGVIWEKSACTYCPFNRLKQDGVERQKRHAEQVADALLLEYTSLALNPRGALYKDRALIDIAIREDYTDTLRIFSSKLNASRWALYRIRRIVNASKTGEKGTVDRCVERMQDFETREGAFAALMANKEKGEFEELRGISYIWIQRRPQDVFPAREELLAIAPATVQTKARYGVPWFDARWNQQTLFSTVADGS